MSEALLLRGGTLVDASRAWKGDVLIRDGRIEAAGPDAAGGADGVPVLDVSGLLVMPGGVDPHVHLAHPVGRRGPAGDGEVATRTADDFHTGTLAAAAGGVTTVLDFALQRKGDALADVVEARMAEAAADAVVDFGLHVIVTDVRDDVLAELPDLIRAGHTSFKAFMTYPDLAMADRDLLRLLVATGEHGGMAYVHCENDTAIRHLTRRFLDAGHTEPVYHARSRPPQVEAEATVRAILLAEVAGAPMCIAHVSVAEAAEAVGRARERGVAVVAETCPHYLTLTEDRYRQNVDLEATRYVCSPPLRPQGHQNALWYGLQDGTLQLVSSDHAPFRLADRKAAGQLDFTRIPNGLPGVETRLPLLFSEGVTTGRISPSRFVALVSTNPARTFGLYPRKGSLQAGADADLVVFDPDREAELAVATLHSAVDYTPYEGMRVKGMPVLTLSRGDVVARDGRPSAERGRGRWVSRSAVSGASIP